MDAVSYAHSAKQAQRIEKFIENPDSNSGIVTVPKVIEAGESVTVPAGRVAVLPNVQVDGTLNVEGEVFIPSGAGLSTVVQKSGDTMTGNLNFASGTRITGDFSNVTDSSRVSFESNVLNSFTVVNSFPNGTGPLSAFRAFNTQSGLNSSFTEIYCDPAQSMVRAGRSGTGSYLPMTFNTNGAERMRIDTAGNVLVTGSGGLGYGTGSGGTVTQLTSKSTAVTLNKPTGMITMNNASLAAGASVVFAVNNSLITDKDTIIVNINNGPNGDRYDLYVWYVTAGVFYLRLKNISASLLSDALVINFTVIKGATA